MGWSSSLSFAADPGTLRYTGVMSCFAFKVTELNLYLDLKLVLSIKVARFRARCLTVAKLRSVGPISRSLMT